MGDKTLLCLVNRDDVRHYACFDSEKEAYDHTQRYAPEFRSFFEVILGERRQKMKFDVDISSKLVSVPDQALDDAIRAIAGVTSQSTTTSTPAEQGVLMSAKLDELADELQADLLRSVVTYFNGALDMERDVLLYTSHGANKRSFHLVINNHAHRNCHEAKMAYDAIHKMMTHKHKDCVDFSVYKSVQQFRLIGSEKFGSGRPKRFANTFMYQGKKITHIIDDLQDAIAGLCESDAQRVTDYMIYQESLITHTLNSFYHKFLMQDLDLMTMTTSDCFFLTYKNNVF
jgi:hypothetical protein